MFKKVLDKEMIGDNTEILVELIAVIEIDIDRVKVCLLRGDKSVGGVLLLI